jgi:hypothetical protein
LKLLELAGVATSAGADVVSSVAAVDEAEPLAL